MAKVILREAAIEDLTDIWDYTFHEWSESHADKYYAAIKSACTYLGENPNHGKTYPEISENLYGFKSGKHIVFFHRFSENEIEVIRILHERMDLKTKIKE